MAKNEQSLKSIESFVRDVLFTNFNQTINEETARSVAEKICDALPDVVAIKDTVADKAASVAAV